MAGVQNRIAWATTTALALLVLAGLAGAVQGGPIDPPGPPGSTGKNVISSLPITISEPGSYVLNSNLTCTACTSGQDGVTIAANNVTLDLQGFELVGVTGSGRAIANTSETPHSGLTVRDGTIRDWGDAAIEFAYYNLGSAVTVDRLSAIDNGGGIAVGQDSVISNCLVEGSTSGDGIRAYWGSHVSKCSARGNAEVGFWLASGSASDISAFSNGGFGIVASASAIESCTASGNGYGTAFYKGGIYISGGSLRSCAASSNYGDEIQVEPGCCTASPATLEDCTAYGDWDSGLGINAGDNVVIRGCAAQGNPGTEIHCGSGCVLEDCTADGRRGDGVTSAGYGIEVGHDSIIRGCTVRNNGDTEIYALNQVLIEDCVAEGYSVFGRTAGDGIRVGFKSTVRGCIVTNNAGNGILAEGTHNRLESNEVLDNSGWGIYLSSVGNMVISNRSQTSGTGDCFDPGSNAFVKVSGPAYINATHPWVNLCG